MRKVPPKDDSLQLRALPWGSPERRSLALRMVVTAVHPGALEAALEDLSGEPNAELRAAILARYQACLSDSTRRDSGCYVRSALLRALGPVVMPADRPLLEQAIATYEFLPPGRSEVAAGLRAAAVVALNETDPVLAGFHAVRLLFDKLTSPMSGEPAVTAAALLGSQGETLALYAYLCQPQPAHSEVEAACIRYLAALPASLLSGLITQYEACDDEIVLLGLGDLLLTHEARHICLPALRDLLVRPRLPNLFRYLVLAMRASRRDELIAELKRMASEEQIPSRAEVLREVLLP